MRGRIGISEVKAKPRGRPPSPRRAAAPSLLLAVQAGAGNAAVSALVRRRQHGGARLARDLDESLVRSTRAAQGIETEFRAKLIQQVRNYNATQQPDDASQTYLDKRMSRLDELEHLLYRWFEANKVGLSENPSARALFGLMNSIQAEHKRVVGARVDAGQGLWTADRLSGEERAEIDGVWDDIVNFRGPFKLIERVHTDSGDFIPLGPVLDRFKVEILANLARLMSRPKGRELIQGIHAGGDPKAIQFVMSPLYKILGGYVGLKATATDEGRATLGFAKGRPKAGAGSGAGVEIAPGVRDASLVDFDEEGELITSPAFVGLGHELIHAAHYQGGTYTPGARVDLPPAYGGDLEEFLTIADPTKIDERGRQRVPRGASKHRPTIGAISALNAGIPTEAEIRAEHGLGIRHGHSSSANPLLHPEVDPATEHDPGEFVKDPVKWLGNWPPPQQPPVLPPVVGPLPAPQPASLFARLSAGIANIGSWFNG